MERTWSLTHSLATKIVRHAETGIAPLASSSPLASEAARGCSQSMKNKSWRVCVRTMSTMCRHLAAKRHEMKTCKGRRPR